MLCILAAHQFLMSAFLHLGYSPLLDLQERVRERVDAKLIEQSGLAEEQAAQTLSLQTQIDVLRAQKLKTEKTVFSHGTDRHLERMQKRIDALVEQKVVFPAPPHSHIQTSKCSKPMMFLYHLNSVRCWILTGIHVFYPKVRGLCAGALC